MNSRLYNFSICFFAVISVVLAIIDYTRGLNSAELCADRVIYIIFVIDYIVRFFISDEKINFFKANILDLIAIVPFNSAFRGLRLLKLSKVLKFVRLIRVGALSARCMTKAKNFLNVNGFKYVICLSIGSIILSSLLMTYFEGMKFQDALWWSFVTTTTVGYGDLSPATSAGRIVASFLMLVGIGLIGSLTSTITSFFLQNQSSYACDSEKVDMVIALYDKLSNGEQELFRKMITK